MEFRLMQKKKMPVAILLSTCNKDFVSLRVFKPIKQLWILPAEVQQSKTCYIPCFDTFAGTTYVGSLFCPVMSVLLNARWRSKKKKKKDPKKTNSLPALNLLWVIVHEGASLARQSQFSSRLMPVF